VPRRDARLARRFDPFSLRRLVKHETRQEPWMIQPCGTALPEAADAEVRSRASERDRGHTAHQRRGLSRRHIGAGVLAAHGVHRMRDDRRRRTAELERPTAANWCDRVISIHAGKQCPDPLNRNGAPSATRVPADTWRDTKRCVDVTLLKNARSCDALLQLRQALAIAQRRDVPRCRARRGGSAACALPTVTVADPQADTAARLVTWAGAGAVRITADDVRSTSSPLRPARCR